MPAAPPIKAGDEATCRAKEAGRNRVDAGFSALPEYAYARRGVFVRVSQ